VVRDPAHRLTPTDEAIPVSMGSKRHGLVTR
jgi:hypothetical protein